MFLCPDLKVNDNFSLQGISNYNYISNTISTIRSVVHSRIPLFRGVVISVVMSLVLLYCRNTKSTIRSVVPGLHYSGV